MYRELGGVSREDERLEFIVNIIVVVGIEKGRIWEYVKDE